MSYTTSEAGVALGTTLGISTALTSPSYTSIGEILDIQQSGKSVKTASVTNLESTYEEFLPTLKSGGTYAITVNRVSNDTGQGDLSSTWGTYAMFKLTLPVNTNAGQSSTGDVFVFKGLVEQMDDVSTITPEKQLIMKVTIKVSGPVTYTAGS